MDNVLKNTPAERFRRSLNYILVGVIPPYAPLQRNINVQDKHIVGVFGDRGGFNAVAPVFNLALSAGCKVTLYFVGTCKEQYLSGKLELEGADVCTGPAKHDSINEFFRNLSPDLLVIGASHSQEGIDAVTAAVMRWDNRVICVEDMYGSAEDFLSSGIGHCIDTLCVIDEFAKENMVFNHRNRRDRIVVTGGPHFDITIDVKKNWSQRRKLLREAMKVDDYHHVFLVAGGLNGTATILRLLGMALGLTGRTTNTKVILRQHPRATDSDKELVKKYRQSNEALDFIDVDKSLAPNSDALLPGVDFVLSGYSTTNHFGILYQMPGVIYVGTSEIIADHTKEKGSPKPPEVEAGAAWYVQNGDEMESAIETVIRRKPLIGDVYPELKRIMEAQAHIAAYNNGHATDRVWGEMLKLMSTD